MAKPGSDERDNDDVLEALGRLLADPGEATDERIRKRRAERAAQQQATEQKSQ
jgi:hypothetical protein